MGRELRWSCVVGAVMVLSLTAGAGADRVVLTDGSSLAGSIERLDAEKLIMDTKFAGMLEIDAAMVQAVETDEPVKVELSSGDRLVGTLKATSDPFRSTIDTAMGEIGFDFENVTNLWSSDAKSPTTLAQEQELDELKKELEAQKPKWTATVEAGGEVRKGNTETVDARGRFELKRTTPDDTLTFFASGAYGEEDDKRNTSEAKGGAKYEYFITERFTWGAKMTLEYDEFEQLDLRAILSTGPGYYWIKEPDHELKTSMGVGYMHESFMDGTTNDQWLMDVGLDYRLDIAEWLRFTHSTDYYPEFEGLDHYRLVSDTAFIVPLAASDVWKLKLGALYEYDSHPRPGVEKLDQTYYANILVEIK